MKLKFPKPKHKSVRKLKAEVRVIFGRYIRMRDSLKTTGTLDYCKCITCSRLIPYKESQAGHFVDCRYNATLFDERNVNAQCARCNVYLGGEILKYRRVIIELHGEGVDIELEDKALEIKRYTVVELEAMRAEYQEKIKELQGGV